MSVLASTFQRLRAFAEYHEGALVAFSGGKDSLVVLDLATRVFRRVVAFHCHFVPGLQVEERLISFAVNRWPSVRFKRYPGPLLIRLMKDALFGDPGAHARYFPTWTLRDAANLARKETGIGLVITGAKYSDALGQGLTHRKRDVEAGRVGDPSEDELKPIAKWNKWHVLSYLQSRNIPLPPSDGRNSGSLDCTPECILWLHDNHPEDFQRYLKVFPYAEAVVRRRDWFKIAPKAFLPK